MAISHYAAFCYQVELGHFDHLAIGPYCKDVAERAKHFQSPVLDDGVARAMNMATDELNRAMPQFLAKPLGQGKLLDLDELVCIEDDKSAVFIENNGGEVAVSVLSFMALDYTQGIYLQGDVSVDIFMKNGYKMMRAKNIHAGYVAGGEAVTEKATSEEEEHVLDSLLEETWTAIQQIVLMEQLGMLADVKRI